MYLFFPSGIENMHPKSRGEGEGVGTEWGSEGYSSGLFVRIKIKSKFPFVVNLKLFLFLSE